MRASPAEDGGQLSDSFDDTRLPTFVAHASLTVDCKSSASLEVSIMSQLMDVDLLTYRTRFCDQAQGLSTLLHSQIAMFDTFASLGWKPNTQFILMAWRPTLLCPACDHRNSRLCSIMFSQKHLEPLLNPFTSSRYP